ncbi:MAG: flagellar hook-length control protein FliK [Pseudomonadota bacterium]
MKNLSLQSIQIAPLKSTSEAMSKSDVSVDKSDSGASKTSFQAELSNQVQAKQAKSLQNKSGQDDKKTLAKTGGQLAGKEPVASSQNKAKRTAAVDDLPVVEGDQNLGINYLSAEHTKIAVDGGVPSDEDGVDAKVNDSPVAVDASIVNLTAPTTLPVPLMTVSLPVQKSTENAVSGSGLVLQSAPAVVSQGSSLDAVLSNALASSKGMNTAVSNDPVDESANQNLDGKVTSDNSRWIDSMLLNAGKQTATQTSIEDALMSKASLSSSKDVAVNDLAAPSSNYQSVLQVANSPATQQAGSANNISAYPGKSGWDQAISQKVVWMVGAGEQSATLTLNPPDLGPLQVVIHVHNDQADTTFISDNAEVRQALENGFSNLRDKMSESGIQLGQANVSTGSQSQQAFQQATQGRAVAQLNDNGFIAQPEVSANVLVRTANGLVDTFA